MEVAQVNSGEMTLRSATDPADRDFALFDPSADSRYVAFVIDIVNERGPGVGVPVSEQAFRLVDDAGATHAPTLVGVNGTPGGGSIDHGDTGAATVVFEVPDAAEPAILRWHVVVYIAIPRRGETIEWVFL